jgi:hypothetical protein
MGSPDVLRDSDEALPSFLGRALDVGGLVLERLLTRDYAGPLIDASAHLRTAAEARVIAQQTESGQLFKDV